MSTDNALDALTARMLEAVKNTRESADFAAVSAQQAQKIQRISHPDDCSFPKRGKARIDGDNAGESRTIRRWTKRRHVLWYGGCLRCISYPDDRYRAEYCPM